MKKIDKLILGSFLGPFILTFLVVDFILLTQYMLKYFDEFVGKDLGFAVFAEMIGYFCINMSPIAFPLGILLASLMTFGNLGEHFELTALKSSGISLLRVMRPLFIFVALLTVFVFYSNNYIVPKANLKAYALLYDIRHAKPALDIREGIFYNGIPNYSIKVNEKLPDDKTLKDIIIYNHSEGVGNQEVIIADSGLMYTFLNERYLMLELFDGNWYKEETANNSYAQPVPLNKNDFESSKIVFSLASFDFKKTKEELFSSNRLMRSVEELRIDVDSMQNKLTYESFRSFSDSRTAFNYFIKDDEIIPESIKERKLFLDSIKISRLNDSTNTGLKYQKKNELENIAANQKPKEKVGTKKIRKTEGIDSTYLSLADSTKNQITAEIDSAVNDGQNGISNLYEQALIQARNLKKKYEANSYRLYELNRNKNRYEIEKYKKFAQAFSCLAMFLIGAPLGAIIKRGGLGLPTLISVVFFIFFYVLSIWGEKWAKEDIAEPIYGVWMANAVLLPIGIFFLTQARADARIFESDYYAVLFTQIKKRFLPSK
ncbi:MAG: LptF/LptG family permease [Bacteroidota bacterium]